MLQPVVDTVTVQANLRGILQRVVDPDLLDETSVAWTTGVRDNDAIKGIFLSAAAGESKSYGHEDLG